MKYWIYFGPEMTILPITLKKENKEKQMSIYIVSKQNKDIRQFQNIKQSRGERNP
jgi:hypothetical protein